MLNLIRNTVSNFRNSAATQSANNFLAAAGITGPTQSKAITQLVADLYASGLWSKMKAVYPMVTDNYNLISYSEDLTNGYWSKNNLTITANAINSPFGNLTADKISEAATTGAHYIGSSAGVLTSTNTYTASSYFKAAERNWVYLYLYNGTSALGAYFNISTGVVGTVNGGVTASIIDAGNGWYRCSVSASVTGTGSSNAGITMAIADNNQSYTGVAGNGIYQFGFQLEQSSTASTYQPILTTPSAFMASQMKYNLKDARDLDAAFRLTWSGGWTYSATGATPNGTNAYADTKFIPSSNLTINDQSYSVYSRSNTAAGNKRELGINYLGDVGVIVRYTGDLFYPAIGSGSYPNVTNTDSRGLFVADRTDGTNIKGYKNGSLVVNSAQNPQLLTTYSAYIGARNSNGTANDFSDRQLAFVHLGQGLTDQDNMLLNQIVEKYQVALSRGVQAAQSFYYNSSYSNEANTYLYSTQITGTTQVSAINTLINGLKANNLWSKMKAVYPFVTDYRNLFAYTEDFSNAYWVKNNSSITSNSAIAPNGTLTADTLIPNAGTNINEPIVYVIVDNTTQTRTISFYAKPAGYNYAYARIGGATPVALALFDLSNGTVVQTQAPAISASIESVGNGWYRCQMVYPNSPSLYAPNIGTCSSTYTISSTGITTTTNGTSGIYIWGAQLESGALATPYQPVLAANSSSTFMSSQMKFNLVNPQDSDAAFRLAFSGGWTYSTNGAQPNGTNGYADTKLIPSTSIASINSAHISFYSRTNSDSNCDIGAATAVPTAAFQVWPKQSNLRYIRVFSNFTPESTTESTAAFYLNSRLNSTNVTGYRNGAVLSTLALNSISTITNSIVISARSDGGTISNYSNRQTAFATIGDGLTDAEAAILYQLVQDYQTTLSRQV